MQLLHIPTAILLFVLFSVSPLGATDYFWIGGSGDWSDISHWATASDGTITHSQAPTANDDVYFDFGSFDSPGQVVTLSTDIIFCRSMNWSTVGNNPTLQGGANVTLNIYGSLVLNPNMTFNFNGRVIFSGNFANNTIDFATHTAGRDLIFSGMGGWTLSSGISVDSAFVFNEGTLTTDGQNIDCLYFHSNSTANRTLNLGASVITIRGETLDPFNGNVNAIIQPMRLHADNLVMNPGNSQFILTGTVIDIWLQGPGVINFNQVTLSSLTGNSKIIPWVPNSNEANIPLMNYNELHLFHQTLLNGSPTINTLILQPDQRYRFEGGETFTFDAIDAVGNCGQNIVLETTNEGNPAIFTTDDNIVVDFVTLRDINAQGSGSFTANEAIDLGNNNGWIINPRTPMDFYWVGDGGNWNDPTHWSFSSGGPSSGCLPSALDDVFFDVNSFSTAGQSVNINVENAYCRTMDWTGATNNPGLTGLMNNALRLTGSLTFIPAMSQSFLGLFAFESDQTGNTITTAGHPFLFDLDFSGLNGEWILQDEIYVEWSIHLYSGILRTNDQRITTNRFWSYLQSTRELYLGSSYILLERHDNRTPMWEATADNLTLEAGNSTIEMTGSSSVIFRNDGAGTIAYNNVILGADESRLFSLIYAPSPTLTIDSLIFMKGGFISGENDVNYWKMTAGENYEFVSDVSQTITELDANGNCESGLIYIRNSQIDLITNFIIDNDHTFERLFVQGVHQTGNGQLSANNSIDGGNNLNWNFTDGNGRTLYWVGDEGDWGDTANWSLSSGGSGGECIPTPIDDVIFDLNSFSTTNPLIFNLQGGMFCRDMTWEPGIINMPSVNTNDIEIYGSLLIQSAIDWSISNTKFKGIDNHTISSGGNQLLSLIFDGGGTYTLMDNLEAEGLRLNWGTFDTNNFDVIADDFLAQGLENPKLLQLRNSTVELYGSSSQFISTFQAVSPSLIIEPGNSQINFTNQSGGLRADYELDFHNVTFAEPTGEAFLITLDATFNSLIFSSSGNIEGNLTTDTLFCAPGKSYVFESGMTQNINKYWQITGNNCTPIELSSSVIGSAAFVSMPEDGEILADFIQMRDISASGGAEFLAGARSTDIANSNIGWVFESVPEFIDVGFLGPDLALCNGDPLEINAYSFSVGETYLWQDGSDNSFFIANQTGTYSVAVTFLSNCVIRDTIEVITAQDFNIDLANDPELCSGESIVFNADVGIEGASYSWQDGSTDPEFTTNTAGEYSVVVTLGNCSATDTTQVSTNTFPALDLGPEINVCDGDDFTIMTDAAAETYLWQDGSMMNSFVGNQGGIYWLEAANGSCVLRDSLTVTYVDFPLVQSLGVDTMLCEGSTYTLNAVTDTGTISWQDGSTNSSFVVSTAGTYSFVANNSGCTTEESIEISYIDVPELDLDNSYEACEGTIFNLSTIVTADSYLWSNGDTGSTFATSSPGSYSLEANFGECTATANFSVNFLTPPALDLGADQSACADSPVVLDAGTTGIWQDGSSASTFVAAESGLYFVTVSDENCTNSDSVAITILPLPIFDLGPDQSGCVGDAVTLQAPPALNLLSWEDGSIDLQRTISSGGIYWLEMEGSNGCFDRDSIMLNFATLPFLELGMDTTVCDFQAYQVVASIGAGDFSWFDGSTASSLQVESSGVVTASLDNNGCITTDSVLVQFKECTIFQAYIPNVFSPNEDGINDSFFPSFDPSISIIDYHMRIFDRWGSPVFESGDPAIGWRGFARSQLAPAAVYVYAIEITYMDDLGVKTEVLKGDVGLMR